jgi:hypothetical protein
MILFYGGRKIFQRRPCAKIQGDLERIFDKQREV